MEYTEYTSDNGQVNGRVSAYKNHLIKNIEVIGQRKLAVIGGDDDFATLKKAIEQLYKKNVHVPEIAFRICIDQRSADAEGNIRFIDELKGKASSFYALILAPFTPAEMQLAAMSDIMGCSAGIANELKTVCGYTQRDYCEMNEPQGLGLTMAEMKLKRSINGDAKKMSAAEGRTAAQLAAYKDKMKGQRCFIMGYKNGTKLDELNVLMNERTFAYNGFCEIFNKTPLRPSFFLLTDAASYLGNGKYIEGMECFINGDISVFEDKFKKKPTYLNQLGNGLVSGLTTFAQMNGEYETAHIMPLYEMLQLALYMNFSEIYIYGFEGLFGTDIDEFGCGRIRPEDGADSYPEKAKAVLERVKAYAQGNNINIYNMSDTTGLSMFETRKFEEIDFTSSSIFGKI